MGIGISAISSKLRSMSKLTGSKVESRQVSVVTYTDRDNVKFPENCNSDILLVQKPFEQNEQGLTAWQDKHGNN